MQNGQVDRIEGAVAILSPNRVCPRAGLPAVLAMPTHLEVHTKLISTPPPLNPSYLLPLSGELGGRLKTLGAEGVGFERSTA